MAAAIEPEDLTDVAVSYEAALFADLDSALEMLDQDRCAVQWDVAVEFGLLEGAMGPQVPLGPITPALVRCVERVPAEVPQRESGDEERRPHRAADAESD